jgi:hypothetical protein
MFPPRYVAGTQPGNPSCYDVTVKDFAGARQAGLQI